MENKTIMNAMKRTYEELEKRNRNNLTKMGDMVHQLRYFDEMQECSKNMVKDKLFDTMNEFGWNRWVKEIKEELALNVKEVGA